MAFSAQTSVNSLPTPSRLVQRLSSPPPADNKRLSLSSSPPLISSPFYLSSGTPLQSAGSSAHSIKSPLLPRSSGEFGDSSSFSAKQQSFLSTQHTRTQYLSSSDRLSWSPAPLTASSSAATSSPSSVLEGRSPPTSMVESGLNNRSQLGMFDGTFVDTRNQHIPVHFLRDLRAPVICSEICQSKNLRWYATDRENSVRTLEQKRQEHELMRREHIRRFEHEMHLLAEQQRKDEQMILQMAQEVENGANTSTTISEPATPPDFRDGLSSIPATSVGGDRLRSNTVPAGVAGFATPNGLGRLSAGQQLMTPPEDAIPRTRTLTSTSALGSSRRLSNENPILFDLQNRHDDVDSVYNLAQLNNATKYFFLDDADAPSSSPSGSATNPSELKFNTTDDKFPILVRRESFNQQLPQPALTTQPVSSSAPQQPTMSSGSSQQPWPFVSRGGRHQHSLSGVQYADLPNKEKRLSMDMPSTYTLFNGISGNNHHNYPDVSHSRQPSQRSISEHERRESGVFPLSASPLPGFNEGLQQLPSPGYGMAQQPMFPQPPQYPYMIYGQQHSSEALYNTHQQSAIIPHPQGGHHHSSSVSQQQNISHLQQPPTGANTMHRSSSSTAGSVMMPMVNRRQSDQDVNRFANVRLESLVNEIYPLCKDQHGCRYLQKKLEERDPEHLDMIFKETYPHVVELMIDPFGNYLCQKLLEHATDEQRTILVETAAPQLVKIALNQHGTRALQKMIEHVSTTEQIHLIVNALKTNVVELIQDLNGNHVIQKCLNRLSSEDAQFIFDAVSENCIAVGTHRHGCCVLQRCIDHASGNQKQQLVSEITTNALILVQDPFGNYVTQYVLDLADSQYKDPLIRRFAGNVCTLSMQKFSSNVIEKCIRIAEGSTRKILIDELLSSIFLEKLLRDSYANYVIQTALDCADTQTRQMLVDAIRPILPSIRNTPYGRRIQSKIVGTSGGATASPRLSSTNEGMHPGVQTQQTQQQQQKQQQQQSQQQYQGFGRVYNGGNTNDPNMLSRHVQNLDLQDVPRNTNAYPQPPHHIAQHQGQRQPQQPQQHQQQSQQQFPAISHRPVQYRSGNAAATPFVGNEYSGYNYM
ncbi:armadillo-type protein [Limtongia smithiae]|uniref:armadillo-type protein n=1 Tax=Limtongia smithiae TaxID=1125753 RepID=UPI0034CD2F8D